MVDAGALKVREGGHTGFFKQKGSVQLKRFGCADLCDDPYHVRHAGKGASSISPHTETARLE